MNDETDGDQPRVEAHQVLAVRAGHGANCSSIGSVVDMLFATAAVGAAVLAAVAAALAREAPGARDPPGPRAEAAASGDEGAP